MSLILHCILFLHVYTYHTHRNKIQPTIYVCVYSYTRIHINVYIYKKLRTVSYTYEEYKHVEWMKEIKCVDSPGHFLIVHQHDSISRKKSWAISSKSIYDAHTHVRNKTQTWISHRPCPWGVHSQRQENRSVMYTHSGFASRGKLFFLLQESLSLAVKSCLNLNPQRNTHHINDNLGKYFTLECMPGFWISASPKPSSVDDSALVLTSKGTQSYTYLTFVTSYCWRNNKKVLGGKRVAWNSTVLLILWRMRYKSINNNNIKRCNYIFCPLKNIGKKCLVPTAFFL